ncbi:MAG: HEAT repeat domain-containing protein, partial [candidate division NC10 bacterium]|nr:HEAT repeat domain-containing protein [candidate division NC10 bacterium]
MPEKEPIGFLKSASVEKLFGDELERLRESLSMAEGVRLFFVEISHTAVLKWIAYLTALESFRDGKKVQEILLHPGLDLPKAEGTGVLFVYTLMESPQQPRPLEGLKESEVRELLKSLNVRRESMARSGWTWVFWCYLESLSALQKEAVDLWVTRSGLYSFCLAPQQAIEPPPYNEELSPVEAAEIAVQASRLEEKITSGSLPLILEADHRSRLGELYPKLGMAERGDEHAAKALEILARLKAFERLKAEYLTRLVHRYEWLNFKGIRQVKIAVKLRLQDIFVPLHFEERVEAKAWEPAEERGAATGLPGLSISFEVADAAPPGEQVTVAIEESTAKPPGPASFSFLDQWNVRATKEITRRVSLHELLKCPKAVVLGDPGSGKSTLLKYIAYKLARDPLQARNEFGLDQPYLPILISIADYALEQGDGLSIPEYLKQGEGELWALFEKALKEGEALVMFDGLDEVVTPGQRIEVARRIEDFVAHYPGNRFLVTSRIAGYSITALSMGFDHYTIAPFEEEEIRRFLRNWYRALLREEVGGSVEADTEAERLYQTITASPGIKRLAGTPLLLTIIALIHHAGVHLPYRRVDLYRLILDSLAETWNLARSLSGRPVDLWLGGRRLDRNLVERILGPIAYKLHGENPGGLIKHEALVEKVARYFEEYDGKKEEEATRLAQDFVQLAQEQVGILTERGLRLFAFTHPTLEEYLAARYLAGLIEAEEIAQKKIYDPRWEEVLLLTAVSLTGEKAEGFVLGIYGYKGELDQLLRRSLLLAARCLADEAEVKFAVKKQILDDFFETLLTTPYAFLQEISLNVIGAFKGGSSEDYLIEKALTALQSGTPGIQAAAAFVLGEFGHADDRIVSALLQALQANDPDVRSAAAHALGWLDRADDRIISALLQTLHDTNSLVREAAARALGQLGR